MRNRWAILLYGLASAVLYSGLLPLWEGFDEIYHYGVVQHFSQTLRLPHIRETYLSGELWDSLDFAPVSHFTQPYLERPSTAFIDYFALSAAERSVRRQSLEAIPSARRNEPSPRLNYEAMQAPVAYLFLAPFDRALAAVVLPTRVFLLRTYLSMAAVALLWSGMLRLMKLLGVPVSWQALVMLMLFSWQTFYASASRIGNDGLATAWLPFFLIAMIEERVRKAALLLALGLLTKASLLVFVPLFAIPLLWQWQRGKVQRSAALAALGLVIAIAGPWYLRNLILYGSLSGNVESTSGVTLATASSAVLALPWLRAIRATAHSGLWTGNNSFTTFSSSTINVVLVGLGSAMVLYAARMRRSPAEILTAAALVLGVAALLATTVTFYVSSGAALIGAMPWYVPLLAPALLPLCALGMSRAGILGKWLGVVTAFLWTYVALATWLVKLIPLYGGMGAGPLRQVVGWYRAGDGFSILRTLSPAPLLVLMTLTGVVVALAIVSCTITIRGLVPSNEN